MCGVDKEVTFMVNKDVMAELEKLGFGADVDALENYIARLQDAAAMGKPEVSDAMYDHLVRLLRQLKPDSEVLRRNWEIEDNDYGEYDKLLEKYGMRSITTITSMDDLYKFRNLLKEIGNPVDLMGSIKLNGHAVRAVFHRGKLVSGSTRGRYKKGRDITRHLKIVLPNYIEAWKDIELVEVRGEMLVKIEIFEKYLKQSLKTPLSSVTSLIRDSATDNEIKLLDMVCYKVLMSDDSNIKLPTLWDEFEHLKEVGFKVPPKAKVQGVGPNNLDRAVELLLRYFEGLMDKGEVEYATDGVVVSINDNDLFYSLGLNGNSWNANFALKMGRYWESNVYSSIIKEVIFVPGKMYLTPKAIIEPVTVPGGQTISTVPLYNVGVMERYGYVPGAIVYFRFGGEQGVMCCDMYGNSVQIN